MGDRPIQHDFTPEEEALARAAYQAHHANGSRQPWEALKGHQRFRWLLTAAVFVATGTMDPAKIRSTYLVGVYVSDWNDLTLMHRHPWIRVRDAMVATLRKEAA